VGGTTEGAHGAAKPHGAVPPINSVARSGEREPHEGPLRVRHRPSIERKRQLRHPPPAIMPLRMDVGDLTAPNTTTLRRHSRRSDPGPSCSARPCHPAPVIASLDGTQDRGESPQRRGEVLPASAIRGRQAARPPGRLERPGPGACGTVKDVATGMGHAANHTHRNIHAPLL